MNVRADMAIRPDSTYVPGQMAGRLARPRAAITNPPHRLSRTEDICL
jgi:hypothetical protein